MFSVPHAEIAYIVSTQLQFIEGGDTFVRLRSLTTDTEVETGRIVVLIETNHLPLPSVERIVAGYGVGIARNLIVDILSIIEHLMVVVIRSADGTHGNHAMVATLVLFEAELLLERVAGIDEECGGVIKAVGREAGLHPGREREWLGVVNLSQQHGGIVLREFAVVGVGEIIGMWFGTESDDTCRVGHLLVGSIESLGKMDTRDLDVAVGQFLIDNFCFLFWSIVVCAGSQCHGCEGNRKNLFHFAVDFRIVEMSSVNMVVFGAVFGIISCG